MRADFAAQREAMVRRQLRARGIHDEKLLEAVRQLPREDFVPEPWRAEAYRDEPAPIGGGQTISQPYMTALMVESLHLEGRERVLDVGAGSGYSAALLALLAAHVFAIERLPALADDARRNLERVGLDARVTVICSDGSRGYSEAAPYDAISVDAGAPEVPPALLEQLNDPGRLVIPVGAYDDQELRVVEKRAGRIQSRMVTLCRFVPLVGAYGWRQ